MFFMTGKAPSRKGNQHQTICPYESFKTKDRYINIAVGNDKLWQKFCVIVGLEKLRDHPDFATNPRRVQNRDSLFPLIQEEIRKRESSHWLTLFEENGIPAGPILSVEEALTQPQAVAREMVLMVTHPVIGRMRVMGIPVKLSETPGSIETAPPRLGEHTEAVLLALGYSGADIQAMRAGGAI